MSNLGKLVGAMIVLSIAGGIFYYYQDDFFASGYKIKITSNCRWSAFISYMKEGEEASGWFTGGKNKTLEFDHKVTSVSVGWDIDLRPPLEPYITVEIYKGNKLLYTETVTRWQTVDWNSGIRITG